MSNNLSKKISRKLSHYKKVLLELQIAIEHELKVIDQTNEPNPGLPGKLHNLAIVNAQIQGLIESQD